MRGLIDGRDHVVRCRAVLSVRIKGETYFWNEYILDDGSGCFATLSYEEDDTGCVWRLFSELTPLRALSAREAAEKREGDKVNLGRGPLRVTLVDRSRVIFVEGDPPEWLVVGDEADFFNAEASGHMLVVSWTGEEVEYYYGGTIPGRKVAETFGLPHLRERPRPASGFSASGAGYSGGRTWAPWLVLVAVVGVTLAALFLSPGRSEARPAPPAKQAASGLVLPIAVSGIFPTLGSARIAGRATVEVGEPGARMDRHEYALRSPNGFDALLIDAAGPGLAEWLLLSREPAPTAWTPVKLAALRAGQPLDWGGQGFRVARVQASRLLDRAGEFPGFSKTGEQRCGLIAREGDEWLFLRWSETELAFYRGRSISEREAKQALGPE